MGLQSQSFGGIENMKLSSKYRMYGWLYVALASALIFACSFLPMISALILSFQSGIGNNLKFTGLHNYRRLLVDETFITSLSNISIFLIFQVPAMLFLALVLAALLNDKNLKFKGIIRTMVFLPCATSLVSSALLFKTLFSVNGLMNGILMAWGILDHPLAWLTHPVLAKVVIILTITWRWTGYNTVFYLESFQNIEPSVYEAAKIDGASTVTQFFKITLPLLMPVIILTAIMSINGTLQLFDEVKNLTAGGPGIATMTVSQYIYDLSFKYNPQFGYAAAISVVVLVIGTLLSFIQTRIGGKNSGY